ncbi:amidohydrolase family protein [Novosphingobium sp. Leaf2]|uniref:amidohydrolase family protein n=1 Tax=Novosphingobium sp. Leaf2 TaxID=1735670 RepID=UPI0009EBC0C8|nr:amidohydrolase family protein [Novosphingobium sp. Leaf2]
MRIDVHGHYTARPFYEALEALPGVTVERRPAGVHFLKRNGSNWLPFWDRMFDPDDLLRDMDAKQIDRRILSLSTPSVYEFSPEVRIALCRAENDRIIARIAADPDRLSAVITLPLPDVEAALAELERVRTAPGVVGLSLGSNLDGVPLSDIRLEPLWARLNELRFPVVEHPMVPTFAGAMDEFALGVRVGFLYDTSLAMARLIYAGVFERYPDFPFVVAHTGAAFVDLLERLDNGYRNYADCRAHITQLPSSFAKRFWYDTCSFYPPFIEMVGGIVGWDRILFGTDYPFVDLGAEHVAGLNIDDATRAAVLGGNAQKLWAF